MTAAISCRLLCHTQQSRGHLPAKRLSQFFGRKSLNWLKTNEQASPHAHVLAWSYFLLTHWFFGSIAYIRRIENIGRSLGCPLEETAGNIGYTKQIAYDSDKPNIELNIFTMCIFKLRIPPPAGPFDWFDRLSRIHCNLISQKYINSRSQGW